MTDLTTKEIKSELDKLNPDIKQRVMEKFALAALGAIPWVGGFISAAANVRTEGAGLKTDLLQTKWLEEHEKKMLLLSESISGIATRFDALGPAIEDRVTSDSFLQIVRKSFRVWDEADTKEKRTYAANLIANSAGTRLCSDDVVRLFIDWLQLYHEAHFAIVRAIYSDPGITRYEIWTQIYGDLPRDDSAEADLFKTMIRDLSMGGVIRQTRDTTEDGRFFKKRATTKRVGSSSLTMESAFEDTKTYVLCELGKQFVHYTMNDVVTRVG